MDNVLDGAFSWEGYSCWFLQSHLVVSVLDAALIVLALWAEMMAAMPFMLL